MPGLDITVCPSLYDMRETVRHTWRGTMQQGVKAGVTGSEIGYSPGRHSSAQKIKHPWEHKLTLGAIFHNKLAYFYFQNF